MNLAVITSGFLPLPASKGGAVENLIENLLNENEKENEIYFSIFSIYDEKAVQLSKGYKNSKFIFIKLNIFVKMLDKITFWIAKNKKKKENSQSYRFIFQRLYYLRKVSKYLKVNNYDKVLLENHPTQYLVLKWQKNYEKYKNRYYYHCHNEFKGTYGCKDMIRNTNKIICVSDFIAKQVRDYLNISEERCIVLKNGIDTKKFSKIIDDEEKEKIKEQYNIKKEEKILLYTGRIVLEKGIKELLQAVLKVKNKNFKLMIVGSALNDIELKTKFEKEVEDLTKELKDKVVFTGFIDYKEIYKFYSIADIAVLPSICDDAAPLTIIESMASGLPIITTNSGGIPEYEKNGCAIILEKDKDLVINLQLQMEKLLQDDEKRKDMSKISMQNAKNLTVENFYKNFIKQIEK